MKSLIVYIYFTFFILHFTFSQSVVASAGSQSDIMTWTLGEIVTETISRSEGSFTQGFNQPIKGSSTGIINVQNDKALFSAYPNPVVDQLTILFEDNRLYKWRLADMNGKIITAGASAEKTNVIDFSDRKTGTYLLKIMSDSESRSVIIIKK